METQCGEQTVRDKRKTCAAVAPAETETETEAEVVVKSLTELMLLVHSERPVRRRI